MELSTSRLLKAVCSRAIGWRAAELTCDAIKRYGQASIRANFVRLAELQRIYRLRLSKSEAMSSYVEGADRLVEDLESHTGEDVLMVVIEVDDLVHCVLLDESGSNLVACFVARDRGVVS